VRGGIHCGRAAKVRAGIQVPGHPPGELSLLCGLCLATWLDKIEYTFGDDVDIVRLPVE
jgi:hypothetical protein